MRHFSLKDLSDILPTPKEKNEAFPYPPYVMLCQVFKLLVENNKHPNFEWRREGWVWIVLFFEAINPIQGQFNVSTIWSPIVARGVN